MAKIGRNDLCPCGSGKKYKNCCINKDTDLILMKSVNKFKAHDFDWSKVEVKSGNGNIGDELQLTYSLIEQIEKVYGISLTDERQRLANFMRESRAITLDLLSYQNIHFAKQFNDLRQCILNRYSGKIETVSRIPMDDFDEDEKLFGANECMTKLPILRLSDIDKLSTFYEDIFKMFPLQSDMEYAIPFNDFVIQVADRQNHTLYVVVHKTDEYFYLTGLTTPVNISYENLEYVWFRSNDEIIDHYEYDIYRSTSDNETIAAPSMRIPIDYLDNMVKAIIQMGHTGVNPTKALVKEADMPDIVKSPYKWWVDVAVKYVNGDKNATNNMLVPSSEVLLIYVWLYTLAEYHRLCCNREVEYRYATTNKVKHVSGDDVKKLLHKSNRHVIDLGKSQIIYVKEGDYTFDAWVRKYHYLGTSVRGHFRHYKNGNTIYIAPYEISYSSEHLAEDACERSSVVMYQDSSDFLHEKSHLEAEVRDSFYGHNIVFKHEATCRLFPWLTGMKRLDFYLPDKNVAIECQGVQHFYQYGKKDDDFENRKRRDEEKYNECKDNGVKLIYYINPDIAKELPVWWLKKHGDEYVTNLNDLYSLLNMLN